MEQTKQNYILWLAMFCIMFASAFITYPFCADILRIQNIENRKKTNFPQFAWSEYGVYTKELESYINDSLPYRDLLIRVNSSIAYYIFNESPADNVVVGRGGWLFLKQELNDFKRINRYTEDELVLIGRSLEEVNDYLKEKDIHFLVFIAPNKSSIYSNCVPQYVKVCDGLSRTEQMVNYLEENTSLEVIFPQEELKAFQEQYPQYPLYMHLDTHWNSLGGYNGAKSLLQRLDINIPGINEIELVQTNTPVFLWNGMDLANAIGMTGQLDEDINYDIKGYSNNVIFWNGNIVVDKNDFTTKCTTISDSIDHRKVIFIRDSFGTSMLPVLAAEFREVYSPHISYLDEEKINLAQQKPDIIIYEVVERSGINLDLMNKFEEN